MDDFVHLEVQSAYSFLWGTFTPEELVREVKNLGQKAVALTDFGLHGAVRFYKAAVSSGIQPILGARISIWDGSLITLLASDLPGYAHLCRLLTVVYRDGTLPQALLSKQDLSHWSEGLICLAGGRDSLIRSSLEKSRIDAAKFSLLELRSVLHNPERLFIVLQNHAQRDSRAGEWEVAERTVRVARELRLPVVATNMVTFLRPEDYAIHKTLIGIQQHHHHRKIRPLPHDRFFLASGEEMKRRVPYSEAIENTNYIASLCRSFSLPLGKLHPPLFQQPETAGRKLAVLGFKELSRLHRPVPTIYIQRLDQELESINRTGLADFFLVVRDVVNFAERKGIRHSIRGSAAGSLAVYLLLGGVDPVAHNLLFERFINEGRGDLPDIDIDFDSDRRDEVIHYLMNLFPKQTAMVSTIHTFRVRSAVRLAARSLAYPLDEISRLATCLPWSLRGRDLHEALENLPELRNSPLQAETRLIRVAAGLTGLPFQSSVHLGGVIIAPHDIKDWTPVGLSPKGLPVGHLDKDDVDILGLLKLDLLGLRMHTAIRKALEIIKEKGISLNLDRMPLNDRKTYALLRSTESVGVFQLESPGQRNLLGRLQPRRFVDLIAEISLFRPGPVEGNMVEAYVRRRHGEDPVRIPHEDLMPVLAETYGIILFQEQVLRIAHVFAGLSYAEADAFRRAMTKDRKCGKMDLLKRQFIRGALAKGHSRMLVEDVFRKVAAFASYGFCKAHAASFAHITYQSAYLKVHHPQAFYLGLLNAGQVGSYPPSLILNEARRRGIPVYPPHVNASDQEYTADGSGIRAPLWVVNGVGQAMARRIVADRQRRGPFLGKEDFLERLPLPDRLVNVLTAAGALDGLESGWGLTQEVCGVWNSA
ncbi:MAG TPA: DNA polymerase III subunit alpha [Desulfomonilaceae bacterium]|nr:DNA polymerase III subunit alpha [Desulfomonilaceae bacterium]